MSALEGIGSLAIVVAKLAREYRGGRWSDCKTWSPAEYDVGHDGDPACPFYQNPSPREEWCDYCRSRADLRDRLAGARTALRAAINRYERTHP